MYALLTDLANRDDGQTTVEYSLVLLFLVIVIVLALTAITGALDDLPQRFADALP
jgi:Flp pilus assembly pilin Flp